MSSGIENEFIDEAGRHSSKYWTKPINLYEKKQSSDNTAFFFVKKKSMDAHINSSHNEKHNLVKLTDYDHHGNNMFHGNICLPDKPLLLRNFIVKHTRFLFRDAPQH
jgi:uncharacterized GH25 family protein